MDEAAPAPVASDTGSTQVTPVQTESGGENLTHEHPGRYEVRREFGRGGMSVVYLAYDSHVGREVAFKQLLQSVIDQAEQQGTLGRTFLARFMREARITGQLEHPSIVPVYEVGRREDGSLYYTQKLIRGRTLTKAFRDAKNLLNRLKLLSHVVDLCQAVGYAHVRGVIHRDIKPDNVMVGEFGETVVLDWGLARVIHEPDHDREMNVDNNDETQEGDVLGTPSYMSPEQAFGRQAQVDEQSDVWSLGAVLYEALTGVPPFTGKNPIQVIMKVQKDPVIPVRQLCPEAPPELCAVAERALQRDKKLRYKRAKQLADDIEAFQSGARVTAYEYSSLQLLQRFIKRNKTVSIISLVALLAILGALGRTWQENVKARHSLSQALLEKSDAASRDLNWVLAQTYAAAARDEEDSAEARFRTVQRGPREIEPVWRLQLASSVEAVALSPDGKRIAAALSDHAVRILDAGSGKELAKCEGHDGRILALAFAPDGQVLVSSGMDRALRVHSLSGGCDLAGRIDAVGVAQGLAISPDGAQLATAETSAVRTFEMPGLRLVTRLDGHKVQVSSVGWSPDGKSLISADVEGSLRLWSGLPARPGQSARTAVKVLRGGGHQPVTRVGFTPGGQSVVTGSQDETVRFYDTIAPETMLRRMNPRQGAITGLSFSSGDTFASLGADASAVLFDAETMSPVLRLPGDDATHAAGLSADGALLVTGNRDGRLRLWRVHPGSQVVGREASKIAATARDKDGKPLKTPATTALATSPSSKRIVTADARGKLHLWALDRPEPLWEIAGPQTPINAVTFSPDGKLIAAVGKEELVHLLSASDGSKAFQLEGHQGAVLSVDFAPDGKTLATGGVDGSVRIWDAHSHALKRQLDAGSPVHAVTFANDGKRIASGAADGTVRVWDPRTGKLQKKIEAGAEAVLALAFSPHRSLLAAAGKDQVIRVFRPDSGALRNVWAGHGGRVYTLSFAPDGETVASASIDGTIRLWDVRTGRTMARFDRPEARGAEFTDDGRWLISIGEKPALQMIALDDKKALASPGKELAKRLKRLKLRFDGINLGDDVEALAPSLGKRK